MEKWLMNILVIGNELGLAHGLPTRYEYGIKNPH